MLFSSSTRLWWPFADTLLLPFSSSCGPIVERKCLFCCCCKEVFNLDRGSCMHTTTIPALQNESNYATLIFISHTQKYIPPPPPYVMIVLGRSATYVATTMGIVKMGFFVVVYICWLRRGGPIFKSCDNNRDSSCVFLSPWNQISKCSTVGFVFLEQGLCWVLFLCFISQLSPLLVASNWVGQENPCCQLMFSHNDVAHHYWKFF